MTGSLDSKHQAFRAGILEVPTAEQLAAYLQFIIQHLSSPKCHTKTCETWKGHRKIINTDVPVHANACE